MLEKERRARLAAPSRLVASGLGENSQLAAIATRDAERVIAVGGVEDACALRREGI